ncbi:MAG: DUF1835 domain-containing protein [Clostridiales bacterium]|nr:DUF1835 domain-containing protein [Clostridiales bacterium]
MIEIVFSESACGALKCAHISNTVLALPLFLSIGDISESEIGSLREKTLITLFSHCPGDIGSIAAREMAETARANLESILSGIKSGECIRIWYSSQPDELCGFYWLSSHLTLLNFADGQISLVKLPEYEPKGEQAFLMHTQGWAGIPPEDFVDYLPLQTSATHDFIRHHAQMWKNLRAVNSPLRATVNSWLLSVPEDFYDCFLRLEISRQPDSFREAMVIGGVIGRHGLGIGDGWLALRMEEMIKRGELEVVEEAPSDQPSYHRMLKKARA